MDITESTNFLRVFRLPNEYPSDYCFGGGHPVTMQLVDWFNAYDQTALWGKESKEFTETEYAEHVETLRGFIREKKYFKSYPTSTFLVVTDYGDSFIVNPETRRNDLQKQMDELNKKFKSAQPQKGQDNEKD